MIVNAYVVIDPRGDRPYISTNPPSADMRKARPDVAVYHYALHVPDAVEPTRTAVAPDHGEAAVEVPTPES